MYLNLNYDSNIKCNQNVQYIYDNPMLYLGNDSYVAFSGIGLQTGGSITFEFRTRSSKGILLYNDDLPKSNESFIFKEIAFFSIISNILTNCDCMLKFSLIVNTG